MSAREINREKTLAAIVDAAEDLIRSGGNDALTAGAVAQKVGLARNSLYRYVDSIDDLRGQVLMRHFPDYVAAVRGAVDKAHSPDEALTAYIVTNLQIAARENHAWMMQLAGGLPAAAHAEIATTHRGLADAVRDLISPYELRNPRLAGDLIQGFIATGFTALENGHEQQDVIDYCVSAALALVHREQNS